MVELSVIPKCCGKKMKIKAELGKFVEAQCSECKDIVYIKKSMIEKPELIDD